jgi:alpha-beta hydrolase superfamily lysophospholipase
MTSPNIKRDQPNGGHVHLGFWSLWASPEGFAGYDRQGEVSSTDSVITSIKQALKAADGRKTDVYVVGHSLGGAVSRYFPIQVYSLVFY